MRVLVAGATEAVGRRLVPELGVVLMTEVRGASNAKRETRARMDVALPELARGLPRCLLDDGRGRAA